MKTQKVTLKIKLESLDIATAKGQLYQMIETLDSGVESGMHSMSDGDIIEWSTERKDVEF